MTVPSTAPSAQNNVVFPISYLEGSRALATKSINNWMTAIGQRDDRDRRLIIGFVERRQKESKSAVTIAFSAAALITALFTAFYFNTQQFPYIFGYIISILLLLVGGTAQSRAVQDDELLLKLADEQRGSDKVKAQNPAGRHPILGLVRSIIPQAGSARTES